MMHDRPGLHISRPIFEPFPNKENRKGDVEVPIFRLGAPNWHFAGRYSNAQCCHCAPLVQHFGQILDNIAICSFRLDALTPPDLI
jgi:hypothetical protein